MTDVNNQNNVEQAGTHNSYKNECVTRVKPHYLRVSDKIFKQMLSEALQNDYEIVENLNTKEKIASVRQITELTNNFFYIRLERDLWQHYHDVSVKEGVWLQQLSKYFVRDHRIRLYCGFSQTTIEKRQQELLRKSQSIATQLYQYGVQLEKNVLLWQPPIDVLKLSKGIENLVKRAQQRLRQSFEVKKKMLTLHCHDYCLIRKFYDLKPNEEQVSFILLRR